MVVRSLLHGRDDSGRWSRRWTDRKKRRLPRGLLCRSIDWTDVRHIPGRRPDDLQARPRIVCIPHPNGAIPRTSDYFVPRTVSGVAKQRGDASHTRQTERNKRCLCGRADKSQQPSLLSTDALKSDGQGTCASSLGLAEICPDQLTVSSSTACYACDCSCRLGGRRLSKHDATTPAPSTHGKPTQTA